MYYIFSTLPRDVENIVIHTQSLEVAFFFKEDMQSLNVWFVAAGVVVLRMKNLFLRCRNMTMVDVLGGVFYAVFSGCVFVKGAVVVYNDEIIGLYRMV